MKARDLDKGEGAGNTCEGSTGDGGGRGYSCKTELVVVIVVGFVEWQGRDRDDYRVEGTCCWKERQLGNLPVHTVQGHAKWFMLLGNYFVLLFEGNHVR